MTRSTRLGVLLVVAGCCLVFAVGGAAVVDATDHRADNETQHEHPDEVDDEGDLAAVQDWLAGRMTEIHLDCAANLSTPETAACDRLDGEYPEYLEQYAAVERDRTGDTRTTETFRETRQDQRALAEETQAFYDTYDEYQAAREAGDEDRSRRLARELAERRDRIQTLGENLSVRFVRLEDLTGRDYSGARRQTNETTMAVSRTTREVQAAEFTPSRLTASVAAVSASFSDPAVVEGRLTAENGIPLLDRTITITVDGRPVATTETDADGRYEATYRPVTTGTGETTVSAWYEPTGTDPFLGSNASDDVVVESVAATAVVELDDDRVAYGDSMPVTARVSVDGVPAAGVPVRVFLDGERVAAGRTGTDGAVVLGGTVPATIPDGDTTVTVRASRPGTALDPAEDRESIAVAESATNLTVDGALDGEDLVVTGRLSANGRPVADQRVGVNVDGETRETAVTDDRGRYTVRVPRETGGRGAWSVTADFENPATNLGPSVTTRHFTVDGLDATNGTDTGTTLLGELRQLAAGSAILRTLTDAELLAVAGGALVVLVATVGAGALVLRRRFWDEETGFGTGGPPDDVTPVVVDVDDGEDGTGASTDAAPIEASGEAAQTLVGPEALDVARVRLRDGAPDEAVRIGYGAVRRELTDGQAVDAGDPRTHWEFLRDAEGALSEERAEALERLTVAYQRAEFAPDGPDTGTARDALRAAETCLSPSTDGRPADVV